MALRQIEPNQLAYDPAAVTNGDALVWISASSLFTNSAIAGGPGGGAGTGFTFTTTAGTAVAATLGTNGLSFAQPPFITTYANDLTSGRAGVGETVTTAAGTNLGLTVNTDGVSIAHPVWLTTSNQSNQPVAASGSNGSFLFSTLQFVTGNGATFITDATGIRLSYTVPTQSAQPVAASGSNGSFAFSTLQFVTGNGASFYTDATGIRLSYSVPAAGDSFFKGWSLAGNTAGTNITALAATASLYLAGGNNVTLSGNSNTISINVAAPGGAAPVLGGYSNLDYFTATVTLGYIQSTRHVVPFDCNNLSFDYIRVEGLPVVLAASTTAATSNTSISCGYTKTHWLHIFSMGTGANFDSLQLHVSTQFLEYFSHRMGQAAGSAGGQVYTNAYTLPCSSGNSAFGYSYSSTAASFNVNSAGITGLTGTKFIEIPFGTSLSAGRWFLMYGASTTTAVQAAGTTIGLRNNVTYNLIYISQAAQSIGVWGAATSNIYGPQQGLGSFTTVGGATTNSLHVTNVTVSAAHPRLYFHLMKSA
jgi:hypothetical protein